MFNIRHFCNFRKNKQALGYTILLLLVSSIQLHSQVYQSPAAIAKWTPSMLLDPDNTLTLGIEVPFTSRWSVQQEIGWGHNSFNLYSTERERFPNRTTWRYRTQIRYYLSRNPTTTGNSYIAGEYLRKNVFTDELRAVGRQCNAQTGNCAFFEEINVRSNRMVNAFHAKFGYLIITSEGLCFDIYLGAGIRDLRVTDNAGSEVLPNLGTNFFNIRPTRAGNYGTNLGLSGGFSIGYAFRKKEKPKAVDLR